MAKKIVKRIVTKVGDVFCAEIEGGIKRYFQYIGYDTSCMSSSVIRVFKTQYPMDYVPDIEKIVEDEVEFYAHTILRVGIEMGVCYKIGKSKNVADEDYENLPFVIMRPKDGEEKPFGESSPLDYILRIWKPNKHIEDFNVPPVEYKDKLEIGYISPLSWIAIRLKTGYYHFTAEEFSYVRRKPYPYVKTFIKDERREETFYYYFEGEDLIEELEECKDGLFSVIVSNGQPERPGTAVFKFGDINWAKRDFITEEEYLSIRGRCF